MKAICYKIDKSFKVDKGFLKYYISLLANAGNLNDIFDICFYAILLSKKSSILWKYEECFRHESFQ